MPINNAGVDRVPGHLAVDQASVHEEDINATQIYRAVFYQSTEFVGVKGTLNSVVRDHIVTQIPREALVQDRASILEEDINATQIYRAAAYQSTEAVTNLHADIQSSLPNMVLAAPSISSLDPTSGVLTGGNSFTILGANFVAGATVTFGSNSATGLVVSSGQITGTVPAGVSVGAVTVTVTNPDSQFATTSYTYTAVPAYFELSPDLGLIDFDAHFDPAANGLLVQLEQSELTAVGGVESTPSVKGLGEFQITLGGTLYEVPLSARRRLRARNGGRVIWRSTTGESGAFRFYRTAPPVFEETQLVR